MKRWRGKAEVEAMLATHPRQVAAAACAWGLSSGKERLCVTKAPRSNAKTKRGWWALQHSGTGQLKGGRGVVCQVGWARNITPPQAGGAPNTALL
jgi:hypothetical protein